MSQEHILTTPVGAITIVQAQPTEDLRSFHPTLPFLAPESYLEDLHRHPPRQLFRHPFQSLLDCSVGPEPEQGQVRPLSPG